MPTAWPTAAELMTRGPVTLPAEAPVSKAVGLMRSRGFHEIPVLRRSRLLGLVTFETIARRVNTALSTKVEHLLILPPLLNPPSPYPEVAEALLAAGLRAAPVVGRRGELLGIVSRTDLVRAFPSLPQLAGPGAPKVEQVASPASTVVRESDLVRSLVGQIRLLEEHPLPVVDRRGRLVGAVGVKDLASVFWRPIQAGKRDPRSDTRSLDVEVASIMRSPPVTVPIGTDVASAARRMDQETVSSVFVVEDGRPVRVLGQTDLLGVIVGRARPSRAPARVADVYVQVTGLRGSGDPELLAEIDTVVAKGLRRLTRSVHPRLLALHFAPHATHRTNDVTVEARLHTDQGIFYASHTGWNLLAGVAGLLDELEGQTRRVRESRQQRSRADRRAVATEDVPLEDAELERRIRDVGEPAD
jgi:CBS domain-containing protein/ribosome-associated translation inhibitor RaiA